MVSLTLNNDHVATLVPHKMTSKYYTHTLYFLCPTSVEEANSYAMALQSSVCEKLANNGCMTRLSNYNTLCGIDEVATTENDAQTTVSGLSIILLLATFAVIQLF